MQLDATWCLSGREGLFLRQFLIEMLDTHIPNPESRAELLKICTQSDFGDTPEEEEQLKQHVFVLLAVYAQELAE